MISMTSSLGLHLKLAWSNNDRCYDASSTPQIATALLGRKRSTGKKL